MIKFKYLTVPDPNLLGFIKSKAEALVSEFAGELGFFREFIVGGVKVRLQLNRYTHTEDWVARVWMERAAITGTSDPVYVLGATPSLFNSVFFVDKTDKPASALGSQVPSVADVRRAIHQGRKVFHTIPYLTFTGNEYFVDFNDPGLTSIFGYPDVYTSVVDPHAGQMYWLPASQTISGTTLVRRIDYDAARVWVRDFGSFTGTSYSTIVDHELSWAALDLTKLNIYYEQTFDVARVGGVIPDGPQTFNVSMALGRFTIPCEVTFISENINFNASTFVKGNWSVAVQSLALSQNDAVAAKITFKFLQRYSNHVVHFVLDRLVFNLDRASVNIPSYATSQLPVELNTQPSINSDPVPVVFRHVNNEANIFDGSGTHIITKLTDVYVTYSNGVNIKMNDPTEDYSWVVGTTPPTMPGVAHTAFVYGTNGSDFTYPFPGVNVFDFNGATWTTGGSALGYSIRRSGFSSLKEKYEILDGSNNVIRQSLRGSSEPVPAFSNSPGLFTQLVRSTIPPSAPDTAEVNIYTLERYKKQDQYGGLTMYDAPVAMTGNSTSSNIDVCVMTEVSVRTGTQEDTSIALTPPGWTTTCSTNLRTINTDALSFGNLAASFHTTQYNNIKTQFTNSLALYGAEIESQDVVNRINASIAFMTQFLTVLPLTDPAAIAAALAPLQAMYDTYATAESDQTFTLKLNALIATPPAFLSRADALTLFAGYMSVHMTLLQNPVHYKHLVFLLAGLGSFVRVRDAQT